MSLKAQILDDFKEAFKNKRDDEKSVLSMLKSEIKNREIDLRLKEQELPDDEIVGVVMRMVKQRRESAQSYGKGGRADLEAQELAEVVILEKYLPAQMSDEEIEETLKKIIAEQEISGKGETGKLMGVAMGKLKGKAEGGRIKEIAERLLS